MTKRVAEDAEGYWYAHKSFDLGFHSVRAHKTTIEQRSKFALDLMREMVKVPFDADGEDSAGRQRGRRQTATEIVDLAFAIADATFAKLEAEGRLLPVPTPEDAEAVYKDTN